MSGFLSIVEMGSGIWTIPPSGHQNQNETGLQDGWLQNLTAVLAIAEPHLRSGVLAGSEFFSTISEGKFPNILPLLMSLVLVLSRSQIVKYTYWSH